MYAGPATPMSNISLVQKGCRDQIVVRIQQALNQRMLPPYNKITKPAKKPLVPDGEFGPKTDDMVREFQRLNRLQIDGVVGPVTRLHLFPWVETEGTLRGKGEFGIPVGFPRGAVARRGLTGDLVADGDKKDGDDEDQQGFQFSPFVAAGTEFTLTKPWPPGSGSAQQTMTFGGVLLRVGKLELSGELERSKALQPKRGDKWEWEGIVKLVYKAVPKVGPVSPLSPFVQVGVPSKFPLSVGIGAEVDIFGKDVLKFTVDGEAAFTYDTKDDDGGKLRAAARVNFGLEFNLDILFRKHPPSKL